MTRDKQHGGRRTGAGRKLTDNVGTVRVTVTLTPIQVAAVEHWRELHELDSFSEALRDIVDAGAVSLPRPSE
jgi:hypothetical protein